ncbi:MAG: DUF2442 domain-containing protein [Gemmatimonadaceae bacterium]|nr:DUF2442 domain-containing protein [Gemmatimonadaceae bacterium]
MAKPLRFIDSGFELEYEAATREGRDADRVEPRAVSAAYDAPRGQVVVELRSGFAFGFSPRHVHGLERASAKQLAAVRVSPSGDGLLWDNLDVQASVTGLIAESLNLREWAPRFMGQARTAAKARAARLNGRKGGRPRKTAKARSKTKTPRG